MRATGNKVFLQREEKKSAAGIITPLSKQGLAIFKVAAVGPGEWNVFTGELIPMNVKVGDRVVADVTTAPEIIVTNKKNGTKIKYNVVPESSIEMIVDDDEDVQ